MARKKTKAYPESFRKEAVRLANLPDRTAVDVANELGIHVGQIYNWRAQFSKRFTKGWITRRMRVQNSVSSNARMQS